MTSRTCALAIFPLLLALSSCGDDTPTAAQPPVASVTISPDSIAITEGDLAYLAAVLRDAGGNVLRNRVVVWSCSFCAVAAVTSSGLVRGLAPGTATIVATSEGVSGEAIVTVMAIPVASVTLMPASLTVVVGETALFEPTLTSADGDTLADRTVTWSSSDTTVASIAPSGRVTGSALGAATITATSEGVSGSAEITVASLMPIASVSAAFYHTCAVTPGGTAYCWGSNSSGALGDGTRDDSSMPVSVSGGLSFASITTGEHHTCGVTTADVAYCWGRNLFGQIGDGTTIDTTMPVQVADGLAFRSLSAGEDHTCGLATSGLVYCWGRNHAGQLGSDSSPDTCGDSREPCSTRPVPVSGGLTFAAVSAFSHGHSCGIDTGGEAYCWGYNSDGQLGDGSTEASPIPIPVAGGLNFEATAVGFLHTCGATSNGTAYCWGMNWYGELGDGTAERHNRLTPTPVVGDRAFASISAGAYHTCGLTTDGRAYCWGQNEAGQLGNGRTEDSAIPVPVAGGLTFESVSAGWLRSCGVTALGALYCWGNGRATPAFVRFAP